MDSQKVIASNGYVNVVDLSFGISDKIVIEHKKLDGSKFYRSHKIYYNRKGEAFFKLKNIRYYLNEFFEC